MQTFISSIPIQECPEDGAARGNEVIVEILLEIGASPTVEDEQGLKALHRAAYGGQTSVVRLLLGRGDVDPNAATPPTLTPLNLAVQEGHVDVVRVLLAREDVDVNHPGIATRAPLYVAMEHKDGEIARLLLERPYIDANLAFRDESVLSLAVMRGATSVVRFLLQHKDIDVNARTLTGRTPLHLATENNETQIVELLLAHPNSDPNVTTNAGLTPLVGAVILGAKGLIKLLAHPNIMADAKNYHSSTPLILAVISGRPEIVSLLLERDDVDINYATNNGETPLLLAVRRRNATITKLPLDHGADTEINREL